MIEEVCGFLDNAGKFYRTEAEVYFANKRLEEKVLQEKVNRLLDNIFHKHAISGYDLSYKMMEYPEEFLKVLWEITRYNFKEKIKQ